MLHIYGEGFEINLKVIYPCSLNFYYPELKKILLKAFHFWQSSKKLCVCVCVCVCVCI